MNYLFDIYIDKQRIYNKNRGELMLRCSICDCTDSENTSKMWFTVRNEIRCETCQHEIEESLYDFGLLYDHVEVEEIENDTLTKKE